MAARLLHWIASPIRIGILAVVLLVAAVGVVTATNGPSHSAAGALAAHRDSDEAGEGAELGSEPSACKGCTPPLLNNLGLTMGSTAQAGVVTITPIYWTPAGLSLSTDYTSIVNRYITDIAAASGRADNVYSVNTEYSRPPSAAGNDKIKYKLATTAPITDTTAFPAANSAAPASPGCTPNPGYTKCVSDKAVQTEITALLSANGLSTGLDHYYPVFFPKGVDVTDSAGGFSDAEWCGIHDAFRTASDAPVIYAEMPYPNDGCDHGQYPQAASAGYSADAQSADSIVGVLSHEVNESITDPALDGDVSWVDSTGHEIGDECSGIYGRPLGSTDASDPLFSEYNQVINGHKYWTQETFSNLTFKAFGASQGCVQKGFVAKGADAATEPVADFGDGHVTASPNSLPADGSSTSTISDTITAPNGEPIKGDSVSFTVQASDGEVGSCGDLSGGEPDQFASTSVLTDAGGEASVTYTASTDDVACDITASEALGGTADFTTVAQGSSSGRVPAITAADTPTSIQAGATPVTFTTSSSNPGTTDLPGAVTTLYLSGDNKGTAGLVSSQVTVTYANDETGGAFVPAAVSGTTVGDGFIAASTQPDEGVTIKAGDDQLTTWRLAIAAGAPETASTSPLTLEVDLDQVNSASGASNNLDYAEFGPAAVTAAPTTPPVTPVVTPTTITQTIIQPVQTIIQTVPAPAATPVGCVVPKLVGKSQTKTKAALAGAKCTSSTLVIPSHKRSQTLTVSKVSPKAGTKTAAGGVVTVTFRATKR